MDITQILLGIIIIIGALIGMFVIPYIKTHMSTEQMGLVSALAKTAVYAAEQLFGAKMGKDKLEYALKLVKEWLSKKGITFDEDIIRAAIEAEVKKMNLEATVDGNVR